MNDLPLSQKSPLAELEEKYLTNESPATSSSTGDVAGPRGSQPLGWSSYDVFVSSSMILVFGFLLFCIMAFLVMKKNSAMDVIRLCALPLIIVSAIFLVVVGYSAEQIAPVLGLLGAIAGYLLGTATVRPQPDSVNELPTTPSMVVIPTAASSTQS